MDGPSSINEVFLVLAFIVPGFLLQAMMEKFGAVQTGVREDRYLSFVVYSALNYAVASPVVYLLVSTSRFDRRPILVSVLWGTIIFVLPITLGVIYGWLSVRGIARRMFNKIGLNPTHPVPTGWDWQFGGLKGSRWVLIKLKDGGQVAGLFDSRSMASSDSKERDIYLSKVFDVQGSGPWKEVDRTDGVLITGDQIQTIEFWLQKKI